MNEDNNMKTGRAIGRTALFCLIAVFSIWGMQGFGTETRTETINITGSADVVFIDSMKIFGKLERPAVPFPHDRHTTILAKQRLDCTTCHLPKANRFSLQFKRIEDRDRQTVMDIYHENCIACHKAMAADSNPSGPVECGGCHLEKPTVQADRQPMGLDPSLHYRHVQALENKCEICHHEYDEAAQKLIYIKDQEDSCRFCHKPVMEKNRRSMSAAAHTACLDCHLKTASQKKKSGPSTCAGCHTLESQAGFEKIAPVPRLNRKQPDSRLIKTSAEPIENRMSFVPFDHKAHEESNHTCRVCHHAGMQNCYVCHTMTGAPEGAKISLEQAMHRPDSASSCLGCHARNQAKRECAGCHTPISGKKRADNGGCGKCHTPLPAVEQGQASLEAETAAAAAYLAERTLVPRLPETQSIPEKVLIKRLSQKYTPVEFPHRKIVTSLFEEIKGSKLAGYFHADQTTLCQGCHHNSPAGLKPPQCGSCHGAAFNNPAGIKPGLLGAYHLQCMECHKKMEIHKPAGCTDCHKEKGQS